MAITKQPNTPYCTNHKLTDAMIRQLKIETVRDVTLSIRIQCIAADSCPKRVDTHMDDGRRTFESERDESGSSGSLAQEISYLRDCGGMTVMGSPDAEQTINQSPIRSQHVLVRVEVNMAQN